MFNISPQEVLLILVIALVVVGPQRLPELGRSIGRGIRELRRAQDDVKRTIRVNLDEDAPDTGPTPAPSPDGSATNGRGATAPEVRATPDTAPSASEPLAAKEVREISRSLGRGLAELRRAREEVQRSFRVDLTEPARSVPPPAAEVPAADGTGSEPGRPPEDQAAG
jgi:sec-independent protein translocase protein TatA